MSKKSTSNRNRHTGHMNAFKTMCVQQGERFLHKGQMYSWFQHPPKLGRMNTAFTLVKF